jgi:hypothetical protein
MLNDRERRVLAMIEQDLRTDGRRFVDAFAPPEPAGERRQRHWPVRALIGFGILLVVVGLLASAGGLFMQGLLFGTAGVAWSRSRSRRAAGQPPVGYPDQPSHRPGQPPPGWFRTA